MIDDMIEKGKQLGITKRIFSEGKYFWYEYAVQKVKDLYYVYESEIFEDKMAEDTFEYENISIYDSLDEVKSNVPQKYELRFEDIHILKGQKIFNPYFYV